MQPYLAPGQYIDFDQPCVAALATELAIGAAVLERYSDVALVRENLPDIVLLGIH